MPESERFTDTTRCAKKGLLYTVTIKELRFAITEEVREYAVTVQLLLEAIGQPFEEIPNKLVTVRTRDVEIPNVQEVR